MILPLIARLDAVDHMEHDALALTLGKVEGPVELDIRAEVGDQDVEAIGVEEDWVIWHVGVLSEVRLIGREKVGGAL